jgi:hypothetical protein
MRSGTMEFFVFGLVVLGCALIGIWMATAMTERTSALQKRVAALEGRMDCVEKHAEPNISPELVGMIIERGPVFHVPAQLRDQVRH